ncbi:MAG: magnesium transporter [Gammaproteobacteria bacterium]
MLATAKRNRSEYHLHRVTKWLAQDKPERVAAVLKALHPSEIAHILESLQRGERETVWQLIDSSLRGAVLVELNEEVRNGLIETTTTAELVDVAESLATDDLADLVEGLSEETLEQVLNSMDNQDRQRLESILCYDENTAGGLMNIDTLTVRQDVSLDVVLRYLRLRGEIPDLTDSLMVVDRQDHFLGLLPLSILLTHDVKTKVIDLMIKEVYTIPVEMPEREVAVLFEKHDLISAPVVDTLGRLLGRITIDDVVDVIRHEADHSLMSMAGLDEDQDMFAPIGLSAKRRALWLGVNLLTAVLASWVIGLFQPTIEKMVALAVLMPVVASMGGIAGTQTLTLVTRGIALRQIGRTNAKVVVGRELAVGALNGMIWSLVIALIAALWFGNPMLGGLIGGAIIITLLCAALAGATIPIALDGLGIDPALAGGVLLTTVTDVVGFLAFLGLAALYLG